MTIATQYTLLKTVARAKLQADREGKALLVLNLNPFGAMWVIREYDERLAREPKVITILPTL
jgi:hypothetical protein